MLKKRRRKILISTWIVPIIFETLGPVPARLSELLEKVEIEDIVRSLQTTVLISTTAILRRVLNL